MRPSFFRLSRVSCTSPRPHPSQLSHLAPPTPVPPPTSSYRALDVSQQNARAADDTVEGFDGLVRTDSTAPADPITARRDSPTPSPGSPHSAASTPRAELPRCTADSSFASTSKLPSLPRAPPSPPPPTASSILLSSLSTSLPTTEPALYRLLRRISSVHPSIRAGWFYHLHSHPLVHATCTSTRTYTFLLDEAFADSDERLVAAILDEMKRRAIPWDRHLGRVLLKGYKKLGARDDTWKEVLARLERDGEGADSGKEWVVEGRSTKRLNLGSKGKGKAKEGGETLGGEGIGWKGWTIRPKELERARRERDEPGVRAAPFAATPPRTKTKRRRPSGSALPQSPTSAIRQRVLVPPMSNELSSSSVSQLVQLLVQDQRTDEAFSLADSWLSVNRPSVPSSSTSTPSTSLVRQTHRYNTTLFVLLNILLKPLLLARSPLSSILSFPSAFTARHAPPLPLPQPLPGLSTLREILSGLSGRQNGWRTGKRVVDHFGYTWGLPVGDRGFEDEASRLRFEVPTCPRWRKHSFLAELDVTLPKLEPAAGVGAAATLGMRPYRFVPASVAVLLLRHAVDAQRSPRTRLDPIDLVRFRKWWTFVTSREAGSDWLRGSKIRALLTRARDVGLLERAPVARKRTAWYLLKDRRAAQNRRKREGTGGKAPRKGEKYINFK